MYRFTRPLAAVAATVLATVATAQDNCLTVKAYGQLSNGEDMAAHGKTLTLSFRSLSPLVGAIEIGGGDAFGAWGLVLGARRTEYVLPWRDTLLAAEPVAIGRGQLDARGRALILLQLGGLGAGGIEPQLELQFFMQAMSVDRDGRPLTSHGLAFDICKGDRRGTGDTDENTWAISAERYTSHFAFAQIASGKLGVEGWRTSLSMSLPDIGWQLVHDRTVREAGVTRVLLSLHAQAADGSGDKSTKHVDVDLGADDPGSVRIHVADRVQGAPALYKLAARVR